MSERPDIIPLYRVYPTSLVAGGTYVALPGSSARLQVIEVAPETVPRTDVAYYNTEPAGAIRVPDDCPSCGEPALCDCADDLYDDMENARRAAEQLSGVLDVIQRIHSAGCDPDSGSLICGTCRVSYPCGTISAIQTLEEPAARLHWAGEWS